MSSSEPPNNSDDEDLPDDATAAGDSLSDEDMDPGPNAEIVGRLIDNANPATSEDISLQSAEIERQKNLDTFRNWVTISLLLACLVLTVFINFFVLYLSDKQWGRVNSLVPITISPFYTLLALAIGYYFGTQHKR